MILVLKSIKLWSSTQPAYPYVREMTMKRREASRQYHEGEAGGVPGAELERLRLIAEHQFQAVTDYQLGALGGPTVSSH